MSNRNSRSMSGRGTNQHRCSSTRVVASSYELFQKLATFAQTSRASPSSIITVSSKFHSNFSEHTTRTQYHSSCLFQHSPILQKLPMMYAISDWQPTRNKFLTKELIAPQQGLLSYVCWYVCQWDYCSTRNWLAYYSKPWCQIESSQWRELQRQGQIYPRRSYRRKC